MSSPHTSGTKEQQRAFKESSAVKALPELDEPPRWGAVPPEKFHLEYGELDHLDGSSKNFTLYAFANGTAPHDQPLVTRRRVLTFPGLDSFDPRMLKFQSALVKDLNEAFSVDLDAEKLFTSTGIHATFDTLKTVAGYFMNPMSYTAVDNDEYRKELGLTPGYTPRQKAIAEEIWKLVWRYMKVSSVNVPKLSTSGMRRFTFDGQYKLAYAEWLFQPINFEPMLNAVQKGDWLTLANRYETIYATYIQKRGQVDTPGKPRMVFDLKYALSAGKTGKPFPADKSVYFGTGDNYSDFSAMRARVVHAGPWTVNCFLQVFSTCAMQSMFERWPTTFHVNTADDIKSVVNGKYVFCSDVKEYDRSMSKDAMRVIFSTAREVLDERIVRAAERLAFSPYFSKPLHVVDGIWKSQSIPTAEKVGRWVRDPRDWSSSGEVFAGNRSGHAWTSLIAKVNKVIDTAFIVDRMFPILGRCDEFLSGKMSIGVVNNGDDEIVWAQERSVLERFKLIRKDKSAGHYFVEGEVGQGFSGLLLVRKGPTEYEPTPRIHTTFEKMWCPERAIGSKHRRFWPIGFNDRIANITKTDIGREAWAIHMSVYRRELHSIGDFQSLLFAATEAMDFDTSGLSEKDRDVLVDPDKLHHKYAESEISDRVLRAITSKIPKDVVEDMLKRYYKGNIV